MNQALNSIPFNSPIVVTLLLVWTLLWKGLALWRAAGSKQRNWFIALLLINSMGILEIVYLFYFAANKLTLPEIRGWFRRR